jgi:hypothetical protein
MTTKTRRRAVARARGHAGPYARPASVVAPAGRRGWIKPTAIVLVALALTSGAGMGARALVTAAEKAAPHAYEAAARAD